MTRHGVIVLILAALLSKAQSQEHFDVALQDNSSSTPAVVTNPNENVTSTLSYQSTEFPIWNSTTSSSNQTTEPTTSTTTSGTSSTTPRPTTSSGTTPTARPTTTMTPVTPTLPPEPVVPKEPWNVTYGSNSTGSNCIMASFAGRIEITYRNVINEEVQTGLDVPDNATVSKEQSHCQPGQDQQVLVLNMATSSVPDGALRVVFQRNQTDNDTILHKIELTLKATEDLFPGLSSQFLGKMLSLSAVNLTLYDTAPKHSYSCDALLKTNLSLIVVGDSSEEQQSTVPFLNGTFETSHLKVQAFLPSSQSTDKFLPNTVCPQDQEQDISSTIPITVGLVLLFLVAIVLVAYFIGRRKQQTYASM